MCWHGVIWWITEQHRTNINDALTHACKWWFKCCILTWLAILRLNLRLKKILLRPDSTQTRDLDSTQTQIRLTLDSDSTQTRLDSDSTRLRLRFDSDQLRIDSRVSMRLTYRTDTCVLDHQRPEMNAGSGWMLLACLDTSSPPGVSCLRSNHCMWYTCSNNCLARRG